MPNGSGGTMIIPTADPTPTPPQQFYGRYLADGGVRVDITYHTDNQQLADHFEVDLLEKMNWTVAPEEPAVESKPTLLGTIGGIWAWAFLAAFLLAILTFFLAMILNIAGLIQFRTIDNMVALAIKADLFVIPTIALMLTGLAIFQDSSQK